MDAPSNCALIVTIREPIHITMKTVLNTWDVCFAGAFVHSINARDRHMKSGPLIIVENEFVCCIFFDFSKSIQPRIFDTCTSYCNWGLCFVIFCLNKELECNRLILNKEISKTNQSKRRTKDPNLVADSIHFVVLMTAPHCPLEVHQHIQMVSFFYTRERNLFS